MSLPPFPEPYSYPRGDYFFNTEQMQTYGQQCRDAGLEEAAQVAATTCHHEATKFADGFNLAAINIEQAIRSLK